MRVRNSDQGTLDWLPDSRSIDRCWGRESDAWLEWTAADSPLACLPSGKQPCWAVTRIAWHSLSRQGPILHILLTTTLRM